ncbi:MAG: hypothetical protein EOT05_02555 [Candidatus Microsaccharimonas sossegonensis]|uniref:Uncharacterized protein n=1 Tax=Candidatus Microsaccharimonas sossegonensis TaxID=2506948 RepID=A0A4Q0AIW2_9BACT|nr:MAG: hypothetical protein EOT05_02555 [Candidatus Microsaccharimonas sossegonensis]
MTRQNDFAVKTSPISTITIPIEIPPQITPVSMEDLPSTDVVFVAENLSAPAIEKVIRHDFTRHSCPVSVYYSKTRARFLVMMNMRRGLITVSDVVSMFAENMPEAVISPVEEILSQEAADMESQSCERFRLLKSQVDDVEMGKIVYLKGSESPSLRTAS